VEIAHLGFEAFLLTGDRAQLISDPGAGRKASTGGEKQTRTGEGSEPDAGGVREVRDSHGESSVLEKEFRVDFSAPDLF
jgi:hypothetical protein